MKQYSAQTTNVIYKGECVYVCTYVCMSDVLFLERLQLRLACSALTARHMGGVTHVHDMHIWDITNVYCVSS